MRTRDGSRVRSDFPRALDANDFCVQFGVPVGRLPDPVLEMVRAGDWRWRRLGLDTRDELVRDVMAAILAGPEPAGDPERWNRGWRENLEAFVASGDPADLTPRYLTRARQPVRLAGDFAVTGDPLFELRWYEVLRRFVFERWLRPYAEVWEFGCGPGHNLAAFAAWDPGKSYFGLDWSTPAVTCVNAAGKATGARLAGREFDFFFPDPDIQSLTDSAILTVGALEQTGARYGRFVEWLISRGPAIVVHVEPILEWHDESKLIDWLAVWYLKERAYWSGFPAHMERLVADGRAEIVYRRRTGVGSLFLEGYMLYVWRPT